MGFFTCNINKFMPIIGINKKTESEKIMTYYSRQHENTETADHELNFLANDMIKRDIGGNGYSISDMVFWYGRSPKLLRHVIEVVLPKKDYHVEYWLWFDEREVGYDPEDYQPNQKIDICVRMKKDKFFN